MQWQVLKRFGEFEGDSRIYYYPVELENDIFTIIDSYILFMKEFPGYKKYRIREDLVKRAHCSNCEATSEWVLEGSNDG